MRCYLRYEPGAVVPQAGICAGGAGQPAFLTRLYFTLFFFLDTCCEYFYLFPAYLEQRKVRAPLLGSRTIRFIILRLIDLRKRIELLTFEKRNGFERTED